MKPGDVVAGKILQLLFGGLLGGIAGGIITGDETYIVVIAVGVPVIFTAAMILGWAGARKRKAAFTKPGTVPGINATVTGQQAPAAPVLNASAGVVLNGEPVVTTAQPAAADPAAPGRKPFGWRALGILTIAAGAALALIPAYGIIGWIGSDIAAGRPFDGRDMRVGLHQQEAFDQIVAVMGDTRVTSINFYDSYIAVSAPTTPGADTVDRYEWKYGHASRTGPDFIQPDDIGSELFDAGDMDMSVVARVVRQSLDEADLDDVDAIYPSIRRWSGELPEISVSIANDYYTASFTYTLDGEQIQRSGSLFD